MGALEYEVRPEFKEYTAVQLLESPVTCFQGVGEIQSDLLERYFQVTTVKDLAEMGPFLQALHVQEMVVGGGPLVSQSVADVSRQQALSFQIRTADQSRNVAELPDASVHVLEGLTPGQDLALYDSFRITNLGHLATNRIMLEARVIEYLAEHGEEQAAEGPVASDALASILDARAATATSGQARAGDLGQSTRAQDVAREVTEHVRDRVVAMRDRARDRATEAPAAGPDRSAGGGVSRMDAIRQSREQGAATGRQDDLDRDRGAGVSRAEQILASRSVGGAGQSAAQSIADRRRGETAGGSARQAADIAAARTGVSRTESVLAARQLSGRGGPPQAGGGSTTPRPRPSTTTSAPSAAARPTGAAASAGAAAGAAGGAQAVATEAEATAGGAGGAGGVEEAPRRATNPVPFIAAAVLVLIVVGGLIWFLVARNAKQTQQQAMGPAPATQNTQTTQPAGTAGTPPAGTTQAGTEGQGAGTSATSTPATGTGQAGTQPGQAGTATTATATTPPAKPPVAVKGMHTVHRGDTLWFISRKEYADPLNWPSIFIENRDKIKHPDDIFPNQKFRIPANPEYRFPKYPQAYQGKR